MLRPAYPPDDAHCPSAGGPARAEGRNPSAEVVLHFSAQRPKHGSLIRERCFDYRVGIRIREVNQLTAVSGLSIAVLFAFVI